jgi:hypothetical protein
MRDRRRHSRDEPSVAMLGLVDAILKVARDGSAKLSGVDAADAIEIARDKLIGLEQEQCGRILRPVLTP